MDENKKQKLIKYIELILEPVGGKYKNDENSHVYYSTIREKGSNDSIISEKNKIIFYYMKLATKYGDIIMGISSDSLSKDLKSAAHVAYSYSGLHSKLTEEERGEVNKKFLELFGYDE